MHMSRRYTPAARAWLTPSALPLLWQHSTWNERALRSGLEAVAFRLRSHFQLPAGADIAPHGSMMCGFDFSHCKLMDSKLTFSCRSPTGDTHSSNHDNRCCCRWGCCFVQPACFKK